MTLTLDLTPEEEARLQTAAARRGLNAEAFAHKLFAASLSALPVEQAPLSDEEWERLADELDDLVDPNVPPLSDYAVSRESFYEGRE